VVANADEDSTSNDAESTEATDAEESSDDEETTEESGDAADESSDDADEDETTTAASAKKQIRPFWPRFGGHGPVVIRRHPSLV